MKRGEQFELLATDYLNKTYGSADISFISGNTADSTKSDIATFIHGKFAFFIEAKDSVAQSGQFVLIPNEQDRQFIFSPRNQSQPNEMTDIIIQHMNDNFDKYNNAGTTGAEIDIDPLILYNWITAYYANKSVKFFITRNKSFIIFPIHRFSKYFAVSAKYRIKKSGSSTPAKKYFNEIMQMIEQLYSPAELSTDGKKLYTTIQDPIDDRSFQVGEYMYYLSEINSGLYEVRRLSNTYNMNVIFSLTVQQDQENEDLIMFERALNL